VTDTATRIFGEEGAMKIGSVPVFCGMMWLAAASGCTTPTSCPANGSGPAITLQVRSPGGVEDVTPTARVDLTRNGGMVSPFAVQYPGTPPSDLIRIYGSGGNYSIVVHHAGYRDTTVTASVLDAECGPAQPPVALIVNLTAL